MGFIFPAYRRIELLCYLPFIMFLAFNQYNKISCLICSLFKIPPPTPRPLYRDIQILKRTVNSVKP